LTIPASVAVSGQIFLVQTSQHKNIRFILCLAFSADRKDHQWPL